MSRESLDQLVLLSDDAINQHVAAPARLETRIDRCYDEGRDLSLRELDLSTQDRDELGLLRDACEIRAARREQADDRDRQVSTRSAQISSAIETRSRENQPHL